MFIKLSIFFFGYFAATGVYVIFLPKILHMVGYNKVDIGIILSIAPLMRFLIPFLFLKIIILNKRVYHISLIIALLSAISFYFTINYMSLFVISNIFLGGALGLILPYVETYSLNYLKKEKYGKSRLYGSIGFMTIGLVLAKYLESKFIIGIDFYLVMLLLTSIFGFSITNKNDDFTKEDKDSKVKFTLLKYKYIWISIFLMQVSFGAFYGFFTLYLNERGISLEIISYLWSFGVICEIFVFQFQSFFFKFNLKSLMQFTIFITAIRWFIVFLFPTSLSMLFLSQSLHAFSFALYHTVTLSYLYEKYANRQLASQFYYGFGYGLGGFLGVIIAGHVYGEYLFLSSTIIVLIAFLFIMIKK